MRKEQYYGAIPSGHNRTQHGASTPRRWQARFMSKEKGQRDAFRGLPDYPNVRVDEKCAKPILHIYASVAPN